MRHIPGLQVSQWGKMIVRMGYNRRGMNLISHNDRWRVGGYRFRSQERIPGQTGLGRPSLLEQKIDERLSLTSLFGRKTGKFILERTHMQPRLFLYILLYLFRY
jgi:hypothetical protein